MLKVKLLNDHYGCMSGIEFPIFVSAKPYDDDGCLVSVEEALKAGVVDSRGVWDVDYEYYFFYGAECEVIEDES